MKYTIFGFSQEEAITFGLDLKDLLLLSWIKDFYPSMQKKIIDNDEYGWINYEYLLNEIPIIEISNKEALRQRLKKLEDKHLLKRKIEKNKSGTYTYIQLTYLTTDLISSTKFEEQKSQLNNNPPKSKVEPKSTQVKSRTKDYSINNSSIKIPPDKEEAKEYYESKGFTFGFEHWYNHNETIGWLVGKNKMKMKCWKSSMNTWQNNKDEWDSKNTNPVQKKSNEPTITYQYVN